MSRDIKSMTLEGVNDGLDNAIRRLKHRMRGEVQKAKVDAISEAGAHADQKVQQAREEMSMRIHLAKGQLEERIERNQHQLGARIDAQARDVSRRLSELDKHHTDALQHLSSQVYDAIEQQNLRQMAEVQSLKTDVDAAMVEQSARMSREVDRLDKKIEGLGNSVGALQQQMHEISVDVDRRFQHQQSQISDIQQRVMQLYNRLEEDDNRKLLAAGQALALLETVRERTLVDRFAPASMQEQVRLLEMRLRGIAEHPESCTISDANQLVDAAIVMENEALREQMKWEVLQNAAQKAVNALLRMMQDSMQLKVDSIYDETQQEELQTNYWTHGAYARVEQEAQKIKQRIDSRLADGEELNRLVEKVNALDEEADALRKEAVERGVLSESRVAVSNDILNAMLGQGWELSEDPGFLGGETEEDAREGTFAVLRKPITGEELSILILPDETQNGLSNRILFHRNDHRVEAPGAFQVRMEQIAREISKSGHKVGQMGEPACGGDGKLSLMEKGKDLRKAGAATDLQHAMNTPR